MEDVIGAKIIIEGDTVQQVGYGLFLAQQALLSGIERFYAANVDEDEVHVLLNGDERKVDRFYEVIKKEIPEGVSFKNMRKEPYESEASIPSITMYLNLLSVDQLIKGREGIVDLGKKMDNVGKNIESMGKDIKSMEKGIEKMPDKIIDSFAERLKKRPE